MIIYLLQQCVPFVNHNNLHLFQIFSLHLYSTMLTNMNSRLQQFLNAENINKAQFAENIGVARASVSHIIAGRNKPGCDFLMSMMRKYPELNIEWLLTGQGTMYKKGAKTLKEPAPMSESPAQIDLSDLFNDLDSDSATSAESAFPSHDDSSSDDGISAASGENRTPPHPSDMPVSPAEREPERKNDVLREINPAPDGIKPPLRQRRAVKVVIFYDDGTFQEF